ncbi:thdF [Wigglesworthia glossinidia endosymbiont of Glossina brevipalpis]|uniref:tRNA modification GTPase MnmE n=1 Tax=Wigglesworthia glossinidia brevipalpis TaxID=36870 RepID=MNME_WIGBR|nr:RecName: Full=tRNA modification GTPase MnmE [Wigglesworthia glossinidia endosymbiont of Glossina brevipalpis]BAC24158.1 thdF [Wigglesworthia glossinidia endosymbiont of Glossina brevipalpis]
MFKKDSIVAIATPPGKGGIGIIRVSGNLSVKIAKIFLKRLPKEKQAEYIPFYSKNGNTLDQGIALFFKSPKSLTGEDVLEFQAHGSPVALNFLLQEILSIKGMRLAKPGEFLERAFINGKIDLIQAEAISDLINSCSIQAAKSALISIRGYFSKKINNLILSIKKLRMKIEVDIDFSEENFNKISIECIKHDLEKIILNINKIQCSFNRGAILKEGSKIVIIGKPNSGKSSIFNILSGNNNAIVTSIEGTTRDILHEHIYLDNIPLHIYDTAGLRKTDDKIEKIGILRALKEIKTSDHILLIVDSNIDKSNDINLIWPKFNSNIKNKITIIRNKIDLSKEIPEIKIFKKNNIISLSAYTGEGVDILIKYLKDLNCLLLNEEGCILARTRHILEIKKAKNNILNAKKLLNKYNLSDFVSEELRIAQSCLEKILGINNNSNDFLNEIFSNFCIGK